MGGLEMRLTIQDLYLTGNRSAAPGTVYSFQLMSRGDGGRAYQMGTSLSTGPIMIGNRPLGLGPDPLLIASTSNTLPGVFGTYTGILSGGGGGQAYLLLPANNQLKGITLHSAFLVLDSNSKFNVKEISGTHTFTIR